MLLFTCNKDGPALNDCLRQLQPGDSLLLLEDAVYAALAGREADNTPPLAGVTLYVLEEDLAARGISDKIQRGFSTVSYSAFVELCLAHTQVVNWN